MADQAMEKLANELIERLGVVEAENKTLRKTNEDLRAMVLSQTKTASEATVKQIDEGLLDTTCEHLVKSGALDRKSTRLNSSHIATSRMPSSA